jgi:hypothetical protein
LVNLTLLVAVIAVAEVVFRLFWNPTYWVRCDRWWIGSGWSEASRKWWPETTYRVESREFQTLFHTNARGYRARPEPARTPRPYRIAFVGDSFTEGMQVDQPSTFCALLERSLSMPPGREVVCENFGVSATGILDYYHRITHDVLRPDPPNALVLCLYPGNDFVDELPDAAFRPDDTPREDFFVPPGRLKHILTWLNLNSKMASWAQRTLHVWKMRYRPAPVQGPPLWWIDPAIAARGDDSPAVRRSRALLREIEAECRRHETKLCVLVVGPAPFYRMHDGVGPLSALLASWGIDAPVIDLAAALGSLPEAQSQRLVFARDGHLNEWGHAFTAAATLEPLRAMLGLEGSHSREIAARPSVPALVK